MQIFRSGSLNFEIYPDNFNPIFINIPEKTGMDILPLPFIAVYSYDSRYCRITGKKNECLYDEEGVFKKDGIVIELVKFDKGKNFIRIFVQDINIIFPGDMRKYPSEALIKKMKPCDILMAPVGGGLVFGHEEAYNLTLELNPSVVIPYRYSINGTPTYLESEENFQNKFMEVVYGICWEGRKMEMPDSVVCFVLEESSSLTKS